MDGSGLPEIRSTCPYCGVGCGVLLRPDGEGGIAVRGDPEHPANFGRLCSKGSALGETVGFEHRLLSPMVNGSARSWNDALQLVADRFSSTIAEHGPDSVAFYVSGQLLTEDYYVANKLMKGFIGSANIDTNSRLCMASSVAGHKRAFGTDTVPGTYEDLDEADLVVLVGSNLAWCHPVLHQRLLTARKKRGTKIVVIDPRRTASCNDADMHLALKPGSDVALFNHLLAEVYESGAVDADFVAHTNGFDTALDAARADVISVTGLSDTQIAEFCKLWINTEKVVTIYSQGVNQSTSGSDKVNAILNSHLATGRIGTPGCGPFSVTGQPNAMGGREVGGLANMLACHLDLENADHRAAVRHFWNAPAMPKAHGLKAVDMFQAVGDGRIKALWIIHTNPAVSMPDADAVRDAIASCPFIVVSDITGATDTARLADVLLPASAWAEKDGTVTNSDRTISRQRKAIDAPGQARPDWDILAEVGRRMGFASAFDFASPAEIFREYAALSGVAEQFGRDFDVSGLSKISDVHYDDMTPQRWPITPTRQGGRFFADGQFYHPDRKARFVPVRFKPPAAKTEPRFPFRLNTGRLRDQWHTMTRTALSPRLSAHLPEPFLDIHPADAGRLGVGTADLVRLTSPIGSAILRARITDSVQPGHVFASIHWTGETAPSARIDAVIAAATDPVSGQPESKASVVSVTRFEPAWYGFAVSRDAMKPTSDYWALSRTAQGYRAEMAGRAFVSDWVAEAKRLFGTQSAKVASVLDPNRGIARIALHEDGVLIGALFVSPTPVSVMRDYLQTLPGQKALDALSGRSPADLPNPGPVLCACFGIGINTILDAIETEGLMTVDAIGEALSAGTNCGSCRPEISDLLLSVKTREAAE
ncbi:MULTISPECIES: nitrate reductase [Marivita]|jgi:assimilatory nitrate reductase catalytic subunit|uniref:Molybdopterin-dependent oxidoreductase n=1 Tax=Marivita cryptomonadis TaxID=505252 RepID=A0A9Q2NWH1_9RHOB|nr:MULTISPECIES: nitrate reductase [Marivita]MCR9170383.1 molybdopterin-dependent oxidoreductase [Paracoccaceae bacterium]MBM2324218.1 molybdopterin-dependent oxidoreductase [Marivita cryptomonadis]MBM2333804.1 molybdopterin-dependent oxidoreductase [Marivita cryptomonadis]MBM2343384.1 molybdopterin-dependent oxidoreductase [Marivita cryptomonadis]MBM2348053.1 molybdopterin-dependent oxidoreductase [Marivita cryptomonadis]